MSLKEQLIYYWICNACATSMGGVWPEGHSATASDIKCEYCQDKNRLPGEFTIPWVDYNWPGLHTEHLRD